MLSLRQGAWFFLLSLAALVSADKLGSLVVQPALGLLAGGSVEAALANVPEVLRFDRRQGELVIRD